MAGVTAAVAAAAAAGVSLCGGPQDFSARGLAQFAGARLEQLPCVLVVAEQLVSLLHLSLVILYVERAATAGLCMWVVSESTVYMKFNE